MHEKRMPRRMSEAAPQFLVLSIIGINPDRAARQIWPELPKVYDKVVQAVQNAHRTMYWRLPIAAILTTTQ
jgi:hypothetical protein